MLTPVSPTASPANAANGLRAATVESGTGKPAQSQSVPAISPTNTAPSIENLAQERLNTLILSTGAAQQGLLQKFADMVAKTLKFERLPGETTEKFFARLAAHLEKMPLAARLVAEMRTGMKALGIDLSDLARALRDPGGPNAARLVALAEAPLMVGRTGSADAVTLSYLDDGAGGHRSTETAQAQKAAQASASGQNLFAPHVENAARQDNPTPDARLLQTMLTRAYREDLPGKSASIKATATQQFADDDPPSGPQIRNAGQQGIAEPIRTYASRIVPAKTEPATLAEGPIADRPMQSDAAARSESVERRPTMLILRGLSEVVSQMADRVAETIRDVIDTPAEARPFPRQLVDHQAPTGHEARPDDLAAADGAKKPTMPVASNSEPASASIPADDISTTDEQKPAATPRADGNRPLAALPESTEAEAVRQTFREPLPVPFAMIPYPVEDEPEKPARNAARQQNDEDETGSDDAGGEQQGREDRHPPGDRQATEEEADEAELLVLNRSSTDADRAYRHYQRMRGF